MYLAIDLNLFLNKTENNKLRSGTVIYILLAQNKNRYTYSACHLFIKISKKKS